MIRKAQDYRDDLSALLSRYRYQPDLTAKLDSLAGKDFSQEVVNEIVLWKVNRYALLRHETRSALHGLSKLQPGKHRDGQEVLLSLLANSGVDLPMASTLLRFQAPEVFQIIDRRAYRSLIGEVYPLRPASKAQRKVALYFDYLDALHELAKSRFVPFQELDRILYIFDKAFNGPLQSKSSRAR